MAIKPVKLRPSQNQAVDYLLSAKVRTDGWGVLALPTGTGKTAIFVAAACEALALGIFDRVIVLAPMVHIEDAVARPRVFKRTTIDGQIRVYNAHEDLWVRPYRAASRNAFARAPAGTSASDLFVEFMQMPIVSNAKRLRSKSFFVTNYSQFSLITKAGALGGGAWARTLVIIDEAHHAGDDEDDAESTQLAKLAAFVRERGGSIWMATATPFRTDGRAIFPDYVRPHVMPYSRLALDGVLPAVIDVVAFDIPEPVRPKGVLLPSDYPKIAQVVVTAKRPASIRLPQGNVTGDARRMGEQIKLALVDLGMSPLRILVAIGDDTQAELAQRLAREQDAASDPKKGYAHRDLDVIISCNRLGEGADWPFCSHDVSVGITMSLSRYLQGLGRACRPKTEIAGYPKDWQNNVLATIIVPAFEETEIERRRLAQQALLLSLAFEGSEAMINFERLWRGCVPGLRLPVRDRAIVEGVRSPAADVVVDGLSYPAAVALRLREVLGREPTIFEIVREIRLATPEIERLGGKRALRRVIRAYVRLIVTVAFDADEMERTITKALNAAEEEARGKIEFEDVEAVYVDALLDAFSALAASWTNVVYPIDATIERLRVRQGFGFQLTPERMRSMALDMEASLATATAFTDAEIIRMHVGYTQRYGVVPHRRNAQQDVSPWMNGRYCSIADIEARLRATKFSLDMLAIAVKSGWTSGPPLTVEAIAAALAKRRMFHVPLPIEEYTEQMPMMRASHDPTYEIKINGKRESVLGLHLALMRGWRGLPGGQTLWDVAKPR